MWGETFILILMVMGGNQPAITAEFSSTYACEQAAKTYTSTLDKRFPGSGQRVVWSCSEK